jgi:hypothetical protein
MSQSTPQPQYRLLKVLGIVSSVILLALAAMCLYGSHRLFGTEKVTLAESVSPDGVHRVLVFEEVGFAQSTTVIQLFKNGKLVSSSKPWEMVHEERVNNDSVSRSRSSIVWKLDDKNATVGVRVFGAFGEAPIAGTVIYETSLP